MKALTLVNHRLGTISGAVPSTQRHQPTSLNDQLTLSVPTSTCTTGTKQNASATVGVFPCHQLWAQHVNTINVLLSTGAIYLDNGSGGKTLTVKGSVLYASTAGEQGGAIYMYSSNGAALITDNVFLDSSSTEVRAHAAPLMLLIEACFVCLSVRLLFDLPVS